MQGSPSHEKVELPENSQAQIHKHTKNQKTLRHRFINTLKTALLEDVLSKDGLLNEWSPMTRDEGTWEGVIGFFFTNGEREWNGDVTTNKCEVKFLFLKRQKWRKRTKSRARFRRSTT